MNGWASQDVPRRTAGLSVLPKPPALRGHDLARGERVRPTIPRHVRRRIGLTLWFIDDVRRVAGWRIAALFVLSLIDAAARISLLVVLIGFVASLSGTEDGIDIRGLELPDQLVDGGIGVWLTITAAVGLVGAGASYARAYVTLQVAEHHALHATRQLLSHIRQPEAGKPAEGVSDIHRSLTRDVTAVYRMARPVLGLIFPAIQGVVIAAVLLWSDAALTLTMAAVGLVGIVPLYLLSAHVADASRAQESAGRELRDRTRAIVNSIALPQFDESMNEALIERHMRDRGTRDRFTPLRSIMMNRTRVDAVVQLVTIVILLTIMTMIARRPTLDASAIAELALFVLLLRLFLGSVRQGVGTAASIGRFYPQFSRYADVTLGKPTGSGRAAESLAPSWLEALIDPTPAGIRAWKTLAVFHPRAVEPSNLGQWLEETVGDLADRPVYLLPVGLDLGGGMTRELSAHLGYILSQPSGVVVVPWRTLTERQVSLVVGQLRSHQVILATHRIKRVPLSIVDAVLYQPAAGPRQHGDPEWWNGLVGTIPDLRSGDSQPGAAAVEDDDDELEDY